MVFKSTDNWFDFPAGCYCGVAVKEKTFKKLQKLLYRQTQEIKEFLVSNKEDIVPIDWTLAYPDGKQTTIHYTRQNESVDDRIRMFDKAFNLRHLDNGLFISDSGICEAGKEVARFYEEMYGNN